MSRFQTNVSSAPSRTSRCQRSVATGRTSDTPFSTDYVPTFVRLAHEYEHLYGDTAMLDIPTRSYAYDVILNDDVVRNKLVHGSDWPVISSMAVVPPTDRA